MASNTISQKRGTKIFDIGQQVYHKDINEPNLKKLKSISLFKEGLVVLIKFSWTLNYKINFNMDYN